MPVLVTPGDTPLGVALVERLAAAGGEVRAFVRGTGDVAALRHAGAFVATGTSDDVGRLEAAMAQVHTVVDLAGGLLSASPERVVEDAMVVATAAAGAGVRRLVTLSLPGAHADAHDPLRRAKGTVEAMLAEAVTPTVVLRTSLVDTRRVRDALVTAGTAVPRDHAVSPLHPDDLVDLLVAFDEVRGEAHEGHVVFHAGGRPTTFGAYVDHVEAVHAAGASGSGRFVGRVYVPPGDVPLLRPALVGPWVGGEPDPSFDAWEFTGLAPRPLAT
ncbi:MAG: SDR family oxidoreductase [Actinomycetes bacterium]